MIKLIPIILIIVTQPLLDPLVPCEDRYGLCEREGDQTEQTPLTSECDELGFCPDQGHEAPSSSPEWVPCQDSYGLCPADQPSSVHPIYRWAYRLYTR